VYNMYVFELVLKRKCLLITCSDSWVPSQQNTNTVLISTQYMTRACETSVKSPQLYA
jgi:hypothetical protein